MARSRLPSATLRTTCQSGSDSSSSDSCLDGAGADLVGSDTGAGALVSTGGGVAVRGGGAVGGAQVSAGGGVAVRGGGAVGGAQVVAAAEGFHVEAFGSILMYLSEYMKAIKERNEYEKESIKIRQERKNISQRKK
jgi:hypothetical protein